MISHNIFNSKQWRASKWQLTWLCQTLIFNQWLLLNYDYVKKNLVVDIIFMVNINISTLLYFCLTFPFNLTFSKVCHILGLRCFPDFVHPTREVNLFPSRCCHLNWYIEKYHTKGILPLQWDVQRIIKLFTWYLLLPPLPVLRCRCYRHM